MANEQQIEYWNGEAGETWVEAQERIDNTLADLSAQAIDAANPGPGERVIDIGCGCGTTTMALAENGASVWGIDISGPMLEQAKERTKGITNVAFTRTDAATQDYTSDHDLVFSRFGVMFFEEPIPAFSNIRTALGENGRLVFICWQKPTSNPWMSVAGAAIQPFLPEPEVPPDPRAPGPFAFADPNYVKEILENAGYSNIRIDPITSEVKLGADVDEAMAFQSRIGPLARALKEIEGDAREQALAAAREALSKHLTEAGLRLGSAAWLVRASR